MAIFAHMFNSVARDIGSRWLSASRHPCFMRSVCSDLSSALHFALFTVSLIFLFILLIFIFHVGRFGEKYPVRFREWGVRHFGRQHPSHKQSPDTQNSETWRRPRAVHCKTHASSIRRSRSCESGGDEQRNRQDRRTRCSIPQSRGTRALPHHEQLQRSRFLNPFCQNDTLVNHWSLANPDSVAPSLIQIACWHGSVLVHHSFSEWQLTRVSLSRNTQRCVSPVVFHVKLRQAPRRVTNRPGQRNAVIWQFFLA